MKFLRFLLLLFAAFSLFVFVTLLNLKIIFSSPDRAKKILNESNLYPVVASGIRDNMVKYADVPESQSKLIEIVSASITESDIKFFTEDFTDQFYAIVKGKNKDKKITLRYSYIKDKVVAELNKNKSAAQAVNIDNLLTDKQVDLGKSPGLNVLVNLNSYLIGFGIASLVFLILLVLSGTWPQKLIWLGATFIIAGAGFIWEVILYYFGMSPKVLKYLADQSGFKDERFLLGTQKLITTVVNFQKIYYLIATIALIILGIIFVVIGNIVKPAGANVPKIEPRAPLKNTPSPAPPTPQASPAPAKENKEKK